eukprot:Hpha_TRINITY_DN18976_c0_g1::TRINITY_DN18976_c0_g1_i1::g.17547::m.17547
MNAMIVDATLDTPAPAPDPPEPLQKPRSGSGGSSSFARPAVARRPQSAPPGGRLGRALQQAQADAQDPVMRQALFSLLPGGGVKRPAVSTTAANTSTQRRLSLACADLNKRRTFLGAAGGGPPAEEAEKRAARRTELVNGLEAVVTAHLKERWKREGQGSAPAASAAARETADHARDDVDCAAERVARRKMQVRAGHAERVRRHLASLTVGSEERENLLARVAQHRRRQRASVALRREEGRDWVRANVRVASQITPARNRARMDMRINERINRRRQVAVTAVTSQDYNHERAWQSVFRGEIQHLLSEAEEIKTLRENALRTWRLVCVHAPFLRQPLARLVADREVRAVDKKRQHAAAIIGRSVQKWVRSIRRQKARNSWRLIRHHLFIMFLWEIVMKRRKAIAVIRTQVSIQSHPFGFTPKVRMFLRGVRMAQQAFRFVSRRKRLFVALVCLQFRRAEFTMILKDDRRVRKLKQSLQELFDIALAAPLPGPDWAERQERQAGQGRAQLVPPHQLAREDLLLKLDDEKGLRVPAGIMLEAVHTFYRERSRAFRADLYEWEHNAAAVTKPRPHLRIVWPRETIERMVLTARAQIVNSVWKQCESLRRCGCTGDLMWFELRKAKTELTSQRDENRLASAVSEMPDWLAADILA